MPREPHFLERATGDSLPASLFALCADGEVIPERSAPKLRVERLTRWYAVGYRTDHHGKRHNWTGGGSDQASLWTALEWAAKRSTMTWYISHGASRVWGLAGLWERIETDLARLEGSDNRDRETDRASSGVQRMRQGEADAGAEQRRRMSGSMQVLQEHVADPTLVGARGSRRAGGRGRLCCLEDPPTIVQFSIPGAPGMLQMCDLRNWGIETFPRSLPVRERAEWIAEVMARMMEHLRSQGWGTMQTTAGSQAMHTLRRRYLAHSIYCHTDPIASELERAAYVGGRCEAGRLGAVPGPIYHLDVRSMYPYVCSVSALPSVLLRTGADSLPALLRQTGDQSGIIAEVSVETEEAAYPQTTARPTIYPVGRFRTTLCGPELADALARGRVRSVGRWAEYAMSPCLKAYADALFAARMRAKAQGDEPMEEWIKRLLVSIVGKFGQRGWFWKSDPSIVARGPWMSWPVVDLVHGPTKQRSIGWHCQIESKDGWAMNASPAIAAWVCSAGRIILLDMIRLIGRDNVIYYDTDSIITTRDPESIPGRLATGMGALLGAWRLIQTAQDCEIWGQKNYRIGERRVCAGSPGDAVETGPDADHYWYRDWLRRAVVRGRRPEVTAMLKTYKRLATYRAGLVGADGRVVPHRREEW